jgi:hypothetical protein
LAYQRTQALVAATAASTCSSSGAPSSSTAFPDQGWLTFRQALSLGGNVRKGERGTTVVYADRFTPEDEKRRAREIGEEAHAIPFLKRFTVFNVTQCEGLPDDIATVAPPPPPGLIEPKVEALIKADLVPRPVSVQKSMPDRAIITSLQQGLLAIC